jgi:hypothetical protein
MILFPRKLGLKNRNLRFRPLPLLVPKIQFREIFLQVDH